MENKMCCLCIKAVGEHGYNNLWPSTFTEYIYWCSGFLYPTTVTINMPVCTWEDQLKRKLLSVEEIHSYRATALHLSVEKNEYLLVEHFSRFVPPNHCKHRLIAASLKKISGYFSPFSHTNIFITFIHWIRMNEMNVKHFAKPCI